MKISKNAKILINVNVQISQNLEVIKKPKIRFRISAKNDIATVNVIFVAKSLFLSNNESDSLLQ